MVELEDFKYGGTNITAVRLVDPGREAVQSVVREWIQGETYYSRQIPFSGKSIKVRRARSGGKPGPATISNPRVKHSVAECRLFYSGLI